MDLIRFQDFQLSQLRDILFIAAGGFEDRCTRALELLLAANANLASVVLLEFRRPIIPENERNLKRMVSWLGHHGKPAPAILQTELIESIGEITSGQRFRDAVVDITSMSNALILRTLRSLSKANISFTVMYTEAEEYYPTFKDAAKYLKYEDDELAFGAAAQQENRQIMYAGLASLGTVRGYEGRLNPTAPTTIILFPTFKRLRIGSILAELEVNRRIFMMGIPVRADLQWRRRALNIINFDLIDSDTDLIIDVSTLSPADTLNALRRFFVDGIINPRMNTVVCPHGSKMQAVGVWQFCQENPDVRVVLSHPNEFFPKKFSTGYRDTFVFDPQSFPRQQRTKRHLHGTAAAALADRTAFQHTMRRRRNF